MPLEAFDGLVHVQLADVDALVRGAAGEGGVGLPVHIQGGRRVEAELLRALAGCRVPDYGRLVHLSIK